MRSFFLCKNEGEKDWICFGGRKGLLFVVKNHHSRQKQKREALKTGKGCLEILCCLDQEVNRKISISFLSLSSLKLFPPQMPCQW